MLNKDCLYLSALSGGADSTALLLMLLDKGYKVEAVHCNFHLRGEESNRDERFCQQLCHDHGVKLHIVHFDTTSYAALHHQSIETAARNLRYRYFLNLAHDIGARGICVAHNRNDQAETLLMNLVRGAGIHGLSGIKPVNHIKFGDDDILIIRPLLNISRAEIESYLRGRNQSWVTDSTNLETDATRNKFRLEIIPMLEKINPSAIENISETCSRLQSVSDIYDNAIRESSGRVVTGETEIHINIENLQKEVSPESVLFEIMSRYDFNGKQANDVFAHINGVSGREWQSPTHQLVIDRSEIIIAPLSANDNFELRILEEGTYVIAEDSKIKIKKEPWNKDSVIPRGSKTVCLDCSKVKFPLTLRTCKTGDRFVPFGMKGSKLVSDFLTDNKLSVIEKRRQLVLCDATGNILWVVGRRPDNRYRINDGTKDSLRIELV